MLPAIPSGLRSAPSAEALKVAFGDGLHVPRPFRMNALRDIRGHVRLESEGVPMAVEGRLGHGRIVLLAFDVTRYPFDVWPGKVDFWHDLLALSEEAPTRLEVRAARSSSWVVQALEAQSTDFPPTPHCSRSCWFTRACLQPRSRYVRQHRRVGASQVWRWVAPAACSSSPGTFWSALVSPCPYGCYGRNRRITTEHRAGSFTNQHRYLQPSRESAEAELRRCYACA